ncbi:protein NAR1 [Trifolium repens]|nr:protein NAR1 [Trifolium repens]
MFTTRKQAFSNRFRDRNFSVALETELETDFFIIKSCSVTVEGETVLKFALCYDFRNLQNIVRKLKTGKYDYHFLEIMACPSEFQIKSWFQTKLQDSPQVTENELISPQGPQCKEVHIGRQRRM